MEGPFSCFPITARSIRQQCVAHSTPDAELASINLAYRTMSIPALDLRGALLPGRVRGIIHEDNSACIAVIESGRNPTMRYIGRTQGINIQMLHETLGCTHPQCPNDLVKTDTDNMVADIHTKGFTSDDKWNHACQLANVIDVNEKDFLSHIEHRCGIYTTGSDPPRVKVTKEQEANDSMDALSQPSAQVALVATKVRNFIAQWWRYFS